MYILYELHIRFLLALLQGSLYYAGILLIPTPWEEKAEIGANPQGIVDSHPITIPTLPIHNVLACKCEYVSASILIYNLFVFSL